MSPTECPSTEYAIPHLASEGGASGVYPPPLPHTKPPMHTLNTFLGKATASSMPPTSQQQPQESFYAATEIVAVSRSCLVEEEDVPDEGERERQRERIA